MIACPDCIYCAKDERLANAMIEVAQLGVSTLYLHRDQTHRGRCVLAYRSHVREWFEMAEPEAALFSHDVSRAAAAIHAVTGAAKLNYGIYGDKRPHLHMHLVPKFEGGPAWGAPFELQPVQRDVRSAAEYAAQVGALRAKLADS